MKFRDTFRFSDDAEFEAQHERKGKGIPEGGRFVAKGSSGGSSESQKANQTTKKKIFGKEVEVDRHGVVVSGLEPRLIGKTVAEVYELKKTEAEREKQRRRAEQEAGTNAISVESSFEEISNFPIDKRTAKYAVQMAVKKAFGTYNITTASKEDISIVVNGVTRNEFARKVGGERVVDKTAISVAKQKIFCIENLVKIVSQGRETGWKHSETHNSGFEFNTFYSRLPFDGQNPVCCVDVRRRAGANAGRKVLYNATTELSHGFREKVRSVGIDLTDEDPSSCDWVVVGVRCSLSWV